jgi:hypothetical protein
MIVLDNQPFTLVEDEGFINMSPNFLIPGRKFMTEMVPEKYDSVRALIAGGCHD